MSIFFDKERKEKIGLIQNYLQNPTPITGNIIPDDFQCEEEYLSLFPVTDIHSTINLDVDRVAILIDRQCYIFTIPDLETETDNSSFEIYELAAYYPDVSAVFTSGVSECLVLATNATPNETNGVPFSILAHISPPNNIRKIEEIIYNTFQKILAQKGLSSEAIPIHFQIYGTTPHSQHIFNNNSQNYTPQDGLKLTADSSSRYQSEDCAEELLFFENNPIELIENYDSYYAEESFIRVLVDAEKGIFFNELINDDIRNENGEVVIVHNLEKNDKP